MYEGLYGRPILNAGAPVAGTDEVQTLTIGGTPTGGTFKLKFEGIETSAITWSATNATLLANIQAALDAHPSLGTNGVVAAAGTLTAGIGTITLTFGANRGKQAIASLITVALNSLTGTSPTLAIAETTPGVNATGRGAPAGATLVDTTNGEAYFNQGTALAPIWEKTTGAKVVEAHTAGDTLLATETGSTHTNTGATGAITIVLPAATVGLEFFFGVGAAQELRIDPNGSETISLPSTGVPGATGKYLAADAVGETVYLRCVKAGNWAVFGFTGTWTAES